MLVIHVNYNLLGIHASYNMLVIHVNDNLLGIHTSYNVLVWKLGIHEALHLTPPPHASTQRHPRAPHMVIHVCTRVYTPAYAQEVPSGSDDTHVHV